MIYLPFFRKLDASQVVIDGGIPFKSLCCLLAQQFNFTYRYINDVLSLKNRKFAEYLEFIYPRELEIKETTETAASSSYLDCYLYIDNGKLTTRLYDKRDEFNFSIVNSIPEQ